METFEYEIIDFMLAYCKNEDVKQVLSTLREIFQFIGYYNYNDDWEEATDTDRCKMLGMVGNRHFDISSIYKGSERKYRCYYCDEVIVTDTENYEKDLWRHLRTEHKEEYEMSQDCETSRMIEEYYGEI